MFSKEFSLRITGTFGDAGVAWLKRLPDILEEAAATWSVKIQPPFQPLSYNYVAPATQFDGNQVVLKAGVPHREFTNEIDALRHFDGAGVVKLLEADKENGLMLLERITPGVPLFESADDAKATSIFAAVIRRMKKSLPENHNFPTVSDWARGFKRLRESSAGDTGPFPKEVFDRAENIMSELIESMSDPIVLHGDLHHWNILSATREPWLALDPKGVIGEPEYEIGAWMRNPFPQILDFPDPKAMIARRFDILRDELGFDKSRIINWSFSQAVLSAIWSYEEGSDDWQGGLACAQLLEECR